MSKSQGAKTLSSLSLLVFTLAVYALLLARLATGYGLLSEPAGTKAFLLVLVAVSCLNGLVMFLSSTALVFRVVLLVQALVVVLYRLSFPSPIEVELSLVAAIILAIVTYEKFPHNLVLCGVFILAMSAVRHEALTSTDRLGPVEMLFVHFYFVVSTGVLSLLGSVVTHHRESIIPVQAEIETLENAVSELTRTNLSYQEYAKRAEQRSTLEERQRLTRDIHDIVGYTLTNSIMMMQAARLMAIREPEKIPALMDKATKNAEVGLQQTREVLRDLRLQEIREESGLAVVSKLVSVFRQATQIQVRLLLGNATWTHQETVGSVVYHFVQEGLINAFRHGRATEIDVLFWETDDELQVTVRDNGSGASVIEEGIGIAGTRERLNKVGGRLEVRNPVDGFAISIHIPLRSERAYEPQENQGVVG